MTSFATNLIDLPQQQSTDYMKVGAEGGAGLGKLVGAFANNAMNARAQDMVKAYNDPSDPTYQGLIGSRRTEALAANLMSVDPALAEQYRTQAQQERMQDYGITLPKISGSRQSKINLLMNEIKKVQKAIDAKQSMGAAGAEQSQVTMPAASPIPAIPTPSGDATPTAIDPSVGGIPLSWSAPEWGDVPTSVPAVGTNPQFQSDLQNRVSNILNGSSMFGSGPSGFGSTPNTSAVMPTLASTYGVQ